MDSQIKTVFLLALLTSIFIAVGMMMGGTEGAVIALFLAAAMNVGSYYYSDRIILKLYKAVEVGYDEAPGLYKIVTDLTKRAGMPMPKVYIIKNDAPNAFATGRSPKHAAVAATTGLLDILNENEVEGVMAHELAHVANRDTLISTIAATIAGALLIFATTAKWGALFGRGRENALQLIIVIVLVPIAAMFIQMMISRSREYFADAVGAKLSNPNYLADALEKISGRAAQVEPLNDRAAHTNHMMIINPMRGADTISKMLSTHPPMEERVKRLRQMQVDHANKYIK